MEVRFVSLEDERYMEFVERCGTVFNSCAWLSMFDDMVEVYGVYNGRELVASFFLYRVKLKGVFSAVIVPPFTPDNSLVIDNGCESLFKRNNFDKKVLTVVSDFVRGLGVSYAEFVMPDNIVDCQPFVWDGFKVSPRYSYLLDLLESEEQIYENISPKIRSSHIQKAIKDGVNVRLSKDYNVIKQFITGTFERQNKGVRTDYLDKILFEFANDNNSYTHIAYIDGQPSAGIFVVYDSKRAYCLMSGFSSDNEHRGAGTLVHYEAILHAKRLGIPVFDFEGSMLKPVENFYRTFGGRLVPKFTAQKKSPLFTLLSALR